MHLPEAHFFEIFFGVDRHDPAGELENKPVLEASGMEIFSLAPLFPAVVAIDRGCPQSAFRLDEGRQILREDKVRRYPVRAAVVYENHGLIHLLIPYLTAMTP